MYWALQSGHVEVAKLLIERGADTSNLDCENNSLVDLATKYCFLDILQLLSDEENFDFDELVNGETLLTSATSRSDFDSVLRLLQEGVNVNACNTSGDTALSCLLRLANYSEVMEVCKLFLTYGADINTINDRSETPLQIACSRNFDKVAELLLELGCETDVKDVKMYSSLHHAACNDNSFSTVLIPI